MLLMVVGYSMLYAALHGHWEFWRYLIPAKSAAAGGAKAAPAATSVVPAGS